MPQITTGLRSVLARPSVYDAFQNVMGAHRIRSQLVSDWIHPFAGSRILDIGCGTARILEYLPDVEYFGFDPSQKYIDKARQRFGDRGEFKCAYVEQADLYKMPTFDIVLATGVLHHLDDKSALSLLELAKSALQKDGRLITIDPCFDPAQNLISRLIVSLDRGQNVRPAKQYEKLACDVFARVEGEIKHRTWIPYTHWVMQCGKQNPDVV